MPAWSPADPANIPIDECPQDITEYAETHADKENKTKETTLQNPESKDLKQN